VKLLLLLWRELALLEMNMSVSQRMARTTSSSRRLLATRPARAVVARAGKDRP